MIHFHLCLLQTGASHFIHSACGFVKLMTLQNVKLSPLLYLSYTAQTRPDVSMAMKFYKLFR